MLDSFIAEKVPFGYVQADGLYGNDSKFISGLDERHVPYICDIPSDTLVYITLPEPVLPERQGKRGRFPTKLKVLNTSPVTVKWLADIQKTWDSVLVRFTDRGIKTVDCAVLINDTLRYNMLPTDAVSHQIIKWDFDSIKRVIQRAVFSHL